jgi:hypothetical protein
MWVLSAWENISSKVNYSTTTPRWDVHLSLRKLCTKAKSRSVALERNRSKSFLGQTSVSQYISHRMHIWVSFLFEFISVYLTYIKLDEITWSIGTCRSTGLLTYLDGSGIQDRPAPAKQHKTKSSMIRRKRTVLVELISRSNRNWRNKSDLSHNPNGIRVNRGLTSLFHHWSGAKLVAVELVVIDKREVIVLRLKRSARQSSNHRQWQQPVRLKQGNMKSHKRTRKSTAA